MGKKGYIYQIGKYKNMVLPWKWSVVWKYIGVHLGFSVSCDVLLESIQISFWRTHGDFELFYVHPSFA